MSRSDDVTLVVIAKEPVAGLVKTRLSPPFSPAQGALLAAAALADTLETVSDAPARRRILVLHGQPGAWVPPNMDVIAQVEGGLDVRLDAALAAADGPVLLVGMDTPQLRTQHLAVSFASTDVVVGPAADGGFWSIGLARAQPGLVTGVPMSRDDTGLLLLARIRERGLRVELLATLRDVDTAADAEEVAHVAPGSRFAATWRRCQAENVS